MPAQGSGLPERPSSRIYVVSCVFLMKSEAHHIYPIVWSFFHYGFNLEPAILFRLTPDSAAFTASFR